MIYEIERLKKAYLAGKTFNFLHFWGHKAANDNSVDKSCLSQWFPCRFMVDDVSYTCTEQYMMAGKARLFGDTEMLSKILTSKDPAQMKAFGRMVSGFNKETWDKSCYNIVRDGNLAKFSQNPALWDFLRASKGKILVEASPLDRVWGIGMGKNNPDAGNPTKWRGKNLLGFALTEVREMLSKAEGE